MTEHEPADAAFCLQFTPQTKQQRGARENFHEIGWERASLRKVAVAVDAGFHSDANMRYLFEKGIDGYVADTLYRKRDPRFATAERHQPRREP